MLKALLKLKAEDYVYLPSGNMFYDGETKSFQSFFIQTTEVSNLEYQTFLNDLIIQKRYNEYETAKVDSNKWVEIYGKGMESMNLYFSHPSYNNYPVCNISRAGAELYCLWLTKELQKIDKRKSASNNQSRYKYIRLPYRSQWCYAASNRKDNQVYPWGWDSVKNEKNNYVVNFKPFSNSYHDDGAFNQSLCRSYITSMNGIFNLSGNVAEMVYENYNSKTYGTAGGSWENNAEEIKIFGPDPYSGITTPHPAIGFRVVLSFFDPY